MKIELKDNIKIIRADEGQLLTFKNSNNQHVFSMLTTPLEYNESNLFEIQKTSVLQN